MTSNERGPAPHHGDGSDDSLPDAGLREAATDDDEPGARPRPFEVIGVAPVEALTQHGYVIGTWCARCGTALWNATSVAERLGPVCRKHRPRLTGGRS